MYLNNQLEHHTYHFKEKIMNIKSLTVLIGSIIVLFISISLFSEVFNRAYLFISELASLYSFGAIAGCGLATVWLIGEFAGQD